MSFTPFTTTTPDGATNIHQRTVPGDLARSRALLATLATPRDRVWPTDRWPRIWFGDCGVQPGADGGHGPIRYRVTEATEDAVGFDFHPPMRGWHGLRLTEESDGRVTWTHTMTLQHPDPVRARVVLPLHDACLEDLLDQVEAELVGRPLRRGRFPVGVRLRRWLMDRRG
ncbi:SRPBCC family protein [Naumannella sp. ID2617S]|nr:SRPBCC family protein [Naumannella sp. ID2617S]